MSGHMISLAIRLVTLIEERDGIEADIRATVAALGQHVWPGAIFGEVTEGDMAWAEAEAIKAGLVKPEDGDDGITQAAPTATGLGITQPDSLGGVKGRHLISDDLAIPAFLDRRKTGEALCDPK